MTAEELSDARLTLSRLWGRRVSCAMLAQAMRLTGNGGKTISEMERGHREVTGPISVCVEMFLAGAQPPDGLP